MKVGYKLKDADGADIETWGGVWGSCPNMPNPLRLPNGDHVHAPSLDTSYGGYTLTEWHMDPPPPVPLTANDYAAAIEKHVDDTARAKAYGGGVSLASYSYSTVPQWQEEAQTFVAWRDAVWAYAYLQMAMVQAGQRTQPSIEDLIAELPEIVWPNAPGT